jgi:hypothetical protein
VLVDAAVAVAWLVREVFIGLVHLEFDVQVD